MRATVIERRHLLGAKVLLPETYVGKMPFRKGGAILVWVMILSSLRGDINRLSKPNQVYLSDFFDFLAKILRKCGRKVLEYGFMAKTL